MSESTSEEIYNGKLLSARKENARLKGLLRQARKVIMDLQEDRRRACEFDLERLDLALTKLSLNESTATETII